MRRDGQQDGYPGINDNWFREEAINSNIRPWLGLKPESTRYNPMILPLKLSIRALD